MAVDYTKVFTIIGKYADKVKDYYAYIDTQTTDKAAIETVLAAQSVVYLGDGLTEMYDSFKAEVSGWTDELISRVEDVLTDEALIGVNFSFGSTPSLDAVWPFLIRDMNDNDKNVTASVATVGSVTYDSPNSADVGVVVIGTMLDGVTPPLNGAPALVQNAGLTTQLTPTSETLTLTCTSDSEHGIARGNESFDLTGTGPESGPYDPLGQNLGSPGSIGVADAQAGTWITNYSFDDWEDDLLTGWTEDAGTGGTDYEEGDSLFFDASGSSLRFTATNNAVSLTQTLAKGQFERQKAYFIAAWARKTVDASSDQLIEVSIADDGGDLVILPLLPTDANWAHFSEQFLIPAEIAGELVLTIACANQNTEDPVQMDNLVIVPCEYFGGVAIAVFDGIEPWLIGDTAVFTISNNNAGEFQTFFRKAFGVQLPTDGSPTISDGLVA